MSEIGEKIIATVRAKAAENPGYVYTPQILAGREETPTGCVYVQDGQPSCIVGHGLWDAGQLDVTIEGQEINLYAFADWNRKQFPVMDQLDGSELRWLSSVQIEQDAGTPWGEAVELADTAVGL